jgi:hypothetical protein
MEPVPGCKTTKQTITPGSGEEVTKGKTVLVKCPPALGLQPLSHPSQVHATGIIQETDKKVTWIFTAVAARIRSSINIFPQFWSTKDPGQQPFSYQVRHEARSFCPRFLTLGYIQAGVGKVIKGAAHPVSAHSEAAAQRLLSRLGPRMSGHEKGRSSQARDSGRRGLWRWRISSLGHPPQRCARKSAHSFLCRFDRKASTGTLQFTLECLEIK